MDAQSPGVEHRAESVCEDVSFQVRLTRLVGVSSATLLARRAALEAALLTRQCPHDMRALLRMELATIRLLIADRGRGYGRADRGG